MQSLLWGHSLGGGELIAVHCESVPPTSVEVAFPFITYTAVYLILMNKMQSTCPQNQDS